MEKQLLYFPKDLRKRLKIEALNQKQTYSKFTECALEFYLSFLEKNKETA